MWRRRCVSACRYKRVYCMEARAHAWARIYVLACGFCMHAWMMHTRMHACPHTRMPTRAGHAERRRDSAGARGGGCGAGRPRRRRRRRRRRRDGGCGGDHARCRGASHGRRRRAADRVLVHALPFPHPSCPLLPSVPTHPTHFTRPTRPPTHPPPAPPPRRRAWRQQQGRPAGGAQQPAQGGEQPAARPRRCWTPPRSSSCSRGWQVRFRTACVQPRARLAGACRVDVGGCGRHACEACAAVGAGR